LTTNDGLRSDPAAISPPRTSHSDAELIARFQAGDLDAFEAFFHRHQAFIYRTAYGLTGDPGSAEEVTQDTFMRAYRHRAVLRLDVSPLPWLHRVTLNLCYTRLGRKRLAIERMPEEQRNVTDHEPEPQEWAERHETARQLRVGLAQLPEIHRSVVVLRYLHGLSLSEVAAILGIRPGTVKSRLHYGLHSLRSIMVGVTGDGADRDAVTPRRTAPATAVPSPAPPPTERHR
jgi:RNA polymerase sigma-70 factor (ECF subfamily)